MNGETLSQEKAGLVIFLSDWAGSNFPDVLTFQTSPDGNVTVSTLVFIPTIKDAGKFVGCRAADMLTGEGSLEDGWELAITCKENSQYINMARYYGTY